MLDQIRTRDADPLGQWISMAAHGILMALLIIAAHHAWQVRPVVGRGGEQSSVLYWDDSVGSGSTRTRNAVKLEQVKAHQAPRLEADERRALPEHPRRSQAEAASAAGSSTSQSQGAGVGDRTQNATPAFPVFSPSPHIDRALLPKTDQNVVVDVNVSAMGDVLDEKLVHGLGTSVDQTILETVKSWKFHPATVDGNAVASVAELVFPLGQKWRG